MEARLACQVGWHRPAHAPRWLRAPRSSWKRVYRLEPYIPLPSIIIQSETSASGFRIRTARTSGRTRSGGERWALVIFSDVVRPPAVCLSAAGVTKIYKLHSLASSDKYPTSPIRLSPTVRPPICIVAVVDFTMAVHLQCHVTCGGGPINMEMSRNIRGDISTNHGRRSD
jgi:hypothetical protein